jgi:hypothetical protein
MHRRQHSGAYASNHPSAFIKVQSKPLPSSERASVVHGRGGGVLRVGGAMEWQAGWGVRCGVIMRACCVCMWMIESEGGGGAATDNNPPFFSILNFSAL